MAELAPWPGSAVLVANPPGETAQQLIVRSDGTIRWSTMAEISAEAWGVGPAATGAQNSLALENANKRASEIGGAIVRLPPGVLMAALREHPTLAGFVAAAWVRGNCGLVGAGRNATTIKLEPHVAANYTAIVSNYHLDASSPDENILFSDFSVDGNGAEQTNFGQGINHTRAANCTTQRVRVQNVLGNGEAGPPGETHLFVASLSGNITYIDCQAIRTAGETADGFGDSNSVNSRYVNCTAQGMTKAFGFAFFNSRNPSLVSCYAQLNPSGYNFEGTENFSMTSCVAGGRSRKEKEGFPWPGESTSLGNTNNGIIVNGSTGSLIDCNSTYNAAGSGLSVIGESAVRVIAGHYEHNNWGIGFSTNAGAAASEVSHETATKNNTTGEFVLNESLGAVSAAGDQLAPAPALAEANVDVANPFPFQVDVYIPGAQETRLFGGAINLGTQSVARLRPGEKIRYAAKPPSWLWLRA